MGKSIIINKHFFNLISMKKITMFIAVLFMASLFLTGCTPPWEDDFTWPWDEAQDEDEDVDYDEDENEDEDDDVTPPSVNGIDDLISFYDEGVLLDFEDYFVGAKLDLLLDYVGMNGVSEMTGEKWDTPALYETGVFNSGEYEDQKFYLLIMPCEGMCMGFPHYRMTIDEQGELTMFSNYSDEWSDYYIEYLGNLFDSTDNLVIPQLEYPSMVFDADTDTYFELIPDSDEDLLADMAKYKIFDDDEAGSVYINRDNECAYARLPDGLALQYEMQIDFSTGQSNASDDLDYYGGTAGEVFDITWSDGTDASEYYSYKGPYGFGWCFYVKNDEYPLSMMDEIGTTGEGAAVYGFNWDQAQALQDLYDMIPAEYLGDDENGMPIYGDQATYEEFLDGRPLFYWFDAYDRMIEFGRADYQPLAEMGKPVIYLYPESRSVVHVEVEPTDGITVSDPEYRDGRGWTVFADPSGELYNFANRTFYPYLFWEGYSDEYVMNDEGFVVSSREVYRFFYDKLAQLGLVEHEIDDFMEFWYPKFSHAPYYFINFLPQDEFEALAPLTVTPTPDTVIRVYMDYVPLRAPIEVVEPEIVTPSRDGFTVIEWGGALHK